MFAQTLHKVVVIGLGVILWGLTTVPLEAQVSVFPPETGWRPLSRPVFRLVQNEEESLVPPPSRSPEELQLQSPRSQAPPPSALEEVPLELNSEGMSEEPAGVAVLEDEAEAAEEEEEEPEEEEAGPAGLIDVPHAVGPFTFEAIYTGELLSNTRGGMNTNRATRYRGNLDLTLTTDLESMLGVPDAEVFVYFGQLHGESLTYDHVNDWQLLSNLDPYPYVTLSQLHEYWYKQSFCEDRFAFKAGRVDANADFGFADIAGEFLNSSFATMPTIPLNVWPAQSLGVTTYTQLTDSLTLAAGAYRSNEFLYLWGNPVAGERDYMALGHLEWRTQIGPNGELPGTWRAGAWIDTTEWNQITAGPAPKLFSSNYGFWATGEQMLWKEQYCCEDTQGCGVFFEYGWAPSDRNYVDNYYGVGVVYRGLLPGRDADSIGLGLAHVHFGPETQATNAMFAESAVELYYRVQCTEFMMIQPDLQYIAQPNGQERDALVAGFRFELVL